jgi:hypothetical protein
VNNVWQRSGAVRLPRRNEISHAREACLRRQILGLANAGIRALRRETLRGPARRTSEFLLAKTIAAPRVRYRDARQELAAEAARRARCPFGSAPRPGATDERVGLSARPAGNGCTAARALRRRAWELAARKRCFAGGTARGCPRPRARTGAAQPRFMSRGWRRALGSVESKPGSCFFLPEGLSVPPAFPIPR